MHATDLGIVYHEGTFTFVARTGASVSPIVQHKDIADDAKALVLLLRNAQHYWEQLPSLVIMGNGAYRLLNELFGATRDLPAATFDWLAAPNGSTFKNAGSEAIARLKQTLDDGKIVLAPDEAKFLAPELNAFSLIVGESKPRYTLPEDVAAAINVYPARALALALVSLEPRALAAAVRTVTENRQRNSAVQYGNGHDPFKSFGHNPYA